MAKKSGKRARAGSNSAGGVDRACLPAELETRLRGVWGKLGHLIPWCDSDGSWMQLFRSEARPYREAFYWEAVAEMVSDHVRNHPSVSPENALTDCLVATQCPASEEDGEELGEFQRAWREILGRSATQIEGTVAMDMKLAKADGTYDAVAALYASDRHTWQVDGDSSA